jgi:hypothetical protein
MSQRITITISIDVPAGASVNVSPSGGGEPPLFDDAPFPTAPMTIPAPSRPLAAGPGDCPVHHVPFTWKEGGVSKAGKAYDGFYKCGEKNPDQSFCTQRPPR